MLHEPRHAIDDGILVPGGAAQRATDNVVSIFSGTGAKREFALTLRANGELQ
jgi:hypothetical protein